MNGIFHPLLWFLVFTYNANSQVLKIQDGKIKTANAILFDSGGEEQNYSNNEQLSLTICPEDNGKYIELTFLEFDTEKEIDILTVIVDSLSQELYQFSGQMHPEIITSKNKNGCLQLYFNSDGNENFSGFKIKIEEVSTPYPTNLDKAGNNNCVVAEPFCASSNYNFPNSTGQPAATGGNFGCLSSRPNPVWYYMRIGQSGSIILDLVQTANANGTGASLDVDFAMWGPFSTTTEACDRIITNTNPLAPIQCSYSSSHQETIALGETGGTSTGRTIPPNAVSGQIYMVLLTNYSNQTGYISFNQTGGTGTVDCSIIPLSINLTSFKGKNIKNQNIISWSTIFSNFTAHFEIEHSTNGYYWETVDAIPPNEMHPVYEVKHSNYKQTTNYYRLVEYNNNGERTELNTLAIDNSIEKHESTKIINTLGQQVDRNTPGIKIFLFDDGTSLKVFN